MFALKKTNHIRHSKSSTKTQSRSLGFESMEPRLLLSHCPFPGHKHCETPPPPPPEEEISYTIVQLGTLGGSESVAYDVNDANQVVGISRNPSEQERAFLWQDVNGNNQSDPGEMIDLGTLGGAFSRALGINNAGQVVGSAKLANAEQHAVLWQDLNGNHQSDPGEMLDLGTLDASVVSGRNVSGGTGINDQGWVVGWSYYRDDPSNPDSDWGQHAFLIVPDMSDSDGDGNPWFAADVDGGNALMIDLVFYRSSIFG